MRWCISKSATTSPYSQLRSDARTSRCSRRRSRAVTAISNFFSARAVAEQLVIDHVGHRGDGVAVADGRSVYVPYTLGGEIVEVAPADGHAERRHLLAIRSEEHT